MSGFSKQDYELINLGVCIKNQADRLGIEHEGVPLEGVVVRIAERARSVVAEEPEWEYIHLIGEPPIQMAIKSTPERATHKRIPRRVIEPGPWVPIDAGKEVADAVAE